MTLQRRGFLVSLLASILTLFFGRLLSFLEIFWKRKALPPYTDPFYPVIKGKVLPIYETVPGFVETRSFDHPSDREASEWARGLYGKGSVGGRFLQFRVNLETRRVGLPRINLGSRAALDPPLHSSTFTCSKWEQDWDYQSDEELFQP